MYQTLGISTLIGGKHMHRSFTMAMRYLCCAFGLRPIGSKSISAAECALPGTLDRFGSWKPLLVVLFLSVASVAQLETGSISGRVTDQTGAVITAAELAIKNFDTGVSQTTKTNGEGFYSFPALKPGRYLMNVRKQGFQAVSVTGIVLNVQDNLLQTFALKVGSVEEAITVIAEANHVNRTDGTVSTVIDRQAAENMPLNGRSFQSLLELAPGINPINPASVGTSANAQGQFTVNGQRPDANYFMVDGVSANTGSSATNSLGQSGTGSLPGTTALGGFNNLVSVDALQEFRVSTSSFAPEYGRTPGGQVSLVTRSGTNSFHGDVFDYFRNTALDANDWFLNHASLPTGVVHQNDFGGVVGGPIVKDKLFFFLSYEGLRLTNPQPDTAFTFTRPEPGRECGQWHESGLHGPDFECVSEPGQLRSPTSAPSLARHWRSPLQAGIGERFPDRP
jgi:Carboxypeptidase regulatory-like domain/TonB-dependent Receptor Plug Domain